MREFEERSKIKIVSFVILSATEYSAFAFIDRYKIKTDLIDIFDLYALGSDSEASVSDPFDFCVHRCFTRKNDDNELKVCKGIHQIFKHRLDLVRPYKSKLTRKSFLLKFVDS